ncbi:DMT family transporter [Treponema sp.]
MGTTAALIIAVLLGSMISIYHPMNGNISRITGSALIANCIFYFFALVSSFLMMVAFGGLKHLGKIKEIPPILYLAGIMSAIMVLGTLVLLPRLGARKLFLLQVTGQIIMAIIVSHFGLIYTPHDPLTLRKTIGALLLIAGAVVSVI